MAIYCEKTNCPSSGTSRPCLLFAPIESPLVQHPCRPVRATGPAGSDAGKLLEDAADRSGGSVESGTFVVLNRICNTGREGIDERFFRIGLRLGW